jgi:Cytochrome c7 and related cytochrome c
MPLPPGSERATKTGTMLVGGLLLLGSLGVAYANSGQLEKAARRDLPAQPIAFSHRLHSAQSLDCTFCHSNPDPGENMTIPDAEFCMNCHQTVAVDKPEIKKLAQFARSGKPIPWVRVYSLPAFVFWRHRSHLAAEQSCAACHGDVAAMNVVRATKVTTMDGCVDCHDKKDANTGCASCHEQRNS